MKILIECKFMEVIRGENDYGWLNCNLRGTTTFSCLRAPRADWSKEEPKVAPKRRARVFDLALSAKRRVEDF